MHRVAESASTDRERATFTQMAAAWQYVVEVAEGEHKSGEPWRAFADFCLPASLC
jgi:hypothetical protein